MEQSPYARKNVRRGIFHYLMGRAFSGVAGIAYVVFLARYMNVLNYAGYTALTGLAMMVSILSGLGLERAVARYVPEGRMHHSVKQLSKFIWRLSIIRFAVVLVLTIAIFFLWPLLMRLFSNSLHMDYFPLSLACFFIAFGLSEYFFYVLQTLVMQKIITRILMYQWGIRLIILFIIVYINGEISLNQAILITAIPEAAVVIVLMYVIWIYLKNLDIQKELSATNSKSWPQWHDIYIMAMHNYSYNVMVSVPQGYFMRLIAAAILSTEFVAAYGFFLTIFEKLRQYLPVQLLYAIIEPTLISGFLTKNDFTKLNTRIQFMLNINMYSIIAILSLYTMFHNDGIDIVTRHKYTQYDWIFCVLLVQLALMTNSQLMTLVVNATGKSYILLFPSALSLTTTICYLYYVYTYSNREYIVFAPIIFYVINNVLAIITLRMSGFMYSVNIHKLLIFFLFSVFLYELTINVNGFMSIDTLFCVEDIICLPYLKIKLIITIAIIVVSFPMLISNKDRLFLKEYFITKAEKL
jgi:O-antigen/teichoic acid export membrane protein